MIHAMIEIREILFDEPAIARKVGELAGAISRDYAGRDLLVVPVLNGACVFAADLMRLLTVPVSVDFVCVSSYGDSMESSRRVVVRKDLDTDIGGKHVLLVDTIVDNGVTISFLMKQLMERNPASLKVAALLDKKCRRTSDVRIDYRGFEIPDRFVVGYGLDYAQRFRNLPYLALVSAAPEKSGFE
jgi:hypoxanthine phosphoribosyltransferase